MTAFDPHATWAALEGQSIITQGRPSVTLEPQRDEEGSRLLERWLNDQRDGLALRATLGQGGMGIVHLAREPSLRREVAVKSLNAQGRNDEGLAKILREAWILARLDHPNIVPIHGLDVHHGPNGEPEPRIVMKRIEGRPWSELLADESGSTLGHADPLEGKLRVLMAVCNAVAYAHSRDILHLDLKPENIMVGTFGEVYVMDWGIAVSMGDDDEGRLPLAKDLRSAVGTPAFLAPEMLECDGRKLSPATDVYLLGGLLFELLTGGPPHRGDTVAEVIHDALFREPKVECEAPRELAVLANRALSIDPEARPARPEDLRMAIERYLEHRGSDKLCDAALENLAELQRELDAPKGGTIDEEAVYDHFGAARFGFVAALDRWPQNERAKEGLTLATERMIDWEIERERPQAAITLVNAMIDAPVALSQRVENARQLHEAKLAEVASTMRDRDPKIGQRARFTLGAIVTTAWWLIPLSRVIRGVDAKTQSYDELINIAWVFMAVAIGFGVWARASLRKTAINRGTLATLVVFLAAQIAFGYAARHAGADMLELQPLLFLLYAHATASMAIFIDRRFAAPALGFALGAWAISLWPDQRNWVLVGTNFVLANVVLWIWRVPLAKRRGSEGREAAGAAS